MTAIICSELEKINSLADIEKENLMLEVDSGAITSHDLEERLFNAKSLNERLKNKFRGKSRPSSTAYFERNSPDGVFLNLNDNTILREGSKYAHQLVSNEKASSFSMPILARSRSYEHREQQEYLNTRSIHVKASSDVSQRALFEFCVLGLHFDDILSDPSAQSIFLPKSAVLLDYYPPTESRYISNLEDFCFPDGISLEKIAANKVKQKVGPKMDQLKIAQFSDENGTTSYACFLLVTEAVFIPYKEPNSGIQGNVVPHHYRLRSENRVEEGIAINGSNVAQEFRLTRAQSDMDIAISDAQGMKNGLWSSCCTCFPECCFCY